jgi:hypothetical protein
VVVRAPAPPAVSAQRIRVRTRAMRRRRDTVPGYTDRRADVAELVDAHGRRVRGRRQNEAVSVVVVWPARFGASATRDKPVTCVRACHHLSVSLPGVCFERLGEARRSKAEVGNRHRVYPAPYP